MHKIQDEVIKSMQQKQMEVEIYQRYIKVTEKV